MADQALDPERDRRVDPAAATPEPSIQVDSGSDADSTYGWDEDSDSTQSLYSSITKHVYENGRRYHSYRQGAYW